MHETARVVLRRAAGQVQGRVAALAERVVAELREREPFFRDTAVAPGDTRDRVAAALEAALTALASPETSGGAARMAWRLGVDRARQGVPLDAVLRAWRIGGEAMWAALVASVGEHEPESMHLMAHAATMVWALVDRDGGMLADAYRETVGELSASPAERARFMIDTLVDGRLDDLGIAGAALLLGVPERGRYAVAIVRSPHLPSGFELREPAGTRLLRSPRKHGAVLVAHLGEQPLAALAEALTVAALGQAGISPVVDRMAALGRAHELAGIALRTCTEEYEVAELDRRLPGSLVAVRPDLGGALVTRVLGRVLVLETADRDTLLSTLAAWVDCGGSAQRAGRRLFCHRNTVLNRLRRLEQLTGRSLAHPRDSMELTLALEAYRIAGWRVPAVAAEA